MRHLDLDLDFDSLCTQTFNEEQSIKRNEALSKTNRGLALMDGNGKEKGPQANKGQQAGGKGIGCGKAAHHSISGASLSMPRSRGGRGR